MELSKKEVKVLWQVSEGISTPEGISSYIHAETEEVKEILQKLQEEKLIVMTVTFDYEQQKEEWSIKVTKKGQKELENCQEILNEFYSQ